MLKFISWETFFTALAFVLGGYYTLSILILYSREIIRLFKREKDTTEQPELPASHHVFMGPIRQGAHRLEQRADEVDASEMSVAADSKLDQESDGMLVGTIADALEEIKTVFAAIVRDQLLRDDTASLLKLLLSRYAQLVGTPYEVAITRFILEQCKAQLPFEFTTEEVTEWWKSLK